jgi:excisionase family DNA binding protein
MAGMQEAAGGKVVEPGQEVYSTREAAERLRVSLRTVQLWSESGVLLAWRTPGGHRRILQSSVEELLRKRGAELARRTASGRYQVLIVEDEPDFRRLFELHLKSWTLPIELESVPSGFDALLRIGAARPDLLITDLRMPGIDGFEMIRSLQASQLIGELEIIVVTALTPHTIAEKGGLPERIAVMYKPLRFEQLRRRLQLLVEGRQRLAVAG